MKLSSGLLVLFGCLPFLDAVEFRSDYQFNLDADGWFKFQLIPATWQDAHLQCYLEGAVLASPTNAQLLKAMRELAINNLNPPGAVFTGIAATYSKGNYYSIEGVPLSELNVKWAPNQPDNLNNSEECLALYPDGTMADVKCQDIFPYICYRKKTEDIPPMTECGTIDSDSAYQLDAETGSCYKFHHVARTWSEAFKTCAAEGGHLAIVNSPYEVQVFQNLFQNSPTPIGVSSSEKNVNLGFRYSAPQKTFLTIHGQTLEQSGYAKWTSNEPNNVKGLDNQYEGEYCGAMYLGPTIFGFNDFWCGHNNTFICEMVPKNSMNETSDFDNEFLRQVTRYKILLNIQRTIENDPSMLYELNNLFRYSDNNQETVQEQIQNNMPEFQDASTINPLYDSDDNDDDNNDDGDNDDDNNDDGDNDENNNDNNGDYKDNNGDDKDNKDDGDDNNDDNYDDEIEYDLDNTNHLHYHRTHLLNVPLIN